MPINDSVKAIILGGAVALFASCTPTKTIVVDEPAPEPPAPLTLDNEIDSMSYAIGIQVATFYKAQGMDSVNFDVLKKAYEDVYHDTTLLLDIETANMSLQEKLQKFMSRKMDREKQKGKEFLDSNATRPNVVTLPSGLQYEILTRGDGPIPKSTDTVSANYIGTLIDGMEFDNSYKRGQPLQIPVTGVIQGWVEALQLMPVGSTWKLYIPSELAYGDRGAGGAIPGGATLIFTIELLNIVNR